MRATFPAIALLLAVSLLSGCAAREYQAKLDYPPVKEAKAAPASGARSTVYLETFNDIRADKTVVGHVRGHSAAKPFGRVFPLRDVSEWVRDALVHELESAGYRVWDGESAPPGAATVSGNILRVFSYDPRGERGEVILHITTVKDGRNVLNRTYTGSGSAGSAYGGTMGELFSESLSTALRAALRQFLADLGKLDL
jgi:hypothetical protein